MSETTDTPRFDAETQRHVTLAVAVDVAALPAPRTNYLRGRAKAYAEDWTTAVESLTGEPLAVDVAEGHPTTVDHVTVEATAHVAGLSPTERETLVQHARATEDCIERLAEAYRRE